MNRLQRDVAYIMAQNTPMTRDRFLANRPAERLDALVSRGYVVATPEGTYTATPMGNRFMNDPEAGSHD